MPTTLDPVAELGTAEDLEAQVGQFAERLLLTALNGMEAITIALGRDLGFYAHLAEHGASNAADVAQHAGVNARYAREWLEQQATAGLIDVESNGDADSEDADARRYLLSPAATECLTRPESLASVGPLFDLFPSVALVYPSLRDAYRSGRGVPYADYCIHDAQGDFNRPAFLNLLSAEWLPAIPGLVERLQRPGARVAEIGCGEGWAAVALAQAYPAIRVDGFDLDEASIAAARRLATASGVADRVRFEVIDVTDDSAMPAGTMHAYDFVCAFEMVHDLAQPVRALRTMRRLAQPDAIVLVVDEKVGDHFEASTDNPLERLFYAASVLHCLPVGMVGENPAGTGAVMRPAVLRRYATQAGFADVEVLPVDYDIFRFYRLHF